MKIKPSASILELKDWSNTVASLIVAPLPKLKQDNHVRDDRREHLKITRTPCVTYLNIGLNPK